MNIAPSLLSADFTDLARDIRMVEKAGARWLHIDVMDGHFVPNLTVGPPVVKSIRRITKLFLDVHLMIEDPGKFVPAFAAAGSDGITIHLEALRRPRQVLRCIRDNGCKAGLSIKPDTPVKKVLPFLDDVDLILVMSVEPGFGGQRFMPAALPKIIEIRKTIDESARSIHLEVDGGINVETGRQAVHAGADALVAGNAVFSAPNPSRVIKTLLTL